MRHIYKLVCVFSVVFICLFNLFGCERSHQDNDTIVVGTISGPETDLMQVAKRVAEKKYHLNIKIIEFNDYSQPNAALNEGSLDANAFQHKLFLDNEMKNKGYKLAVIGKTFVYPMAIYSRKIKDIKNVPENALVAIPNDTSNEARALLLLSKAGLIKLNSTNNLHVTPKDIVSNPKKLIFKELDAAQLPRVLPDVTLSVINTNYALVGGLYLDKDAVFIEDKTSPYVNLIVARADNANDPRLKLFVQAFQSKEVIEKASILFKKQAIVGW